MPDSTVHFEQFLEWNLTHHRTMPVRGVETGEQAIAMVEKYLRKQLRARFRGGTVPALGAHYIDFTAKIRVRRQRRKAGA